MPIKPKGCRYCGGPKPKGQGVQVCDDCQEKCPTHGRPSKTQYPGCKGCQAAYMRAYLKRNPEAAEKNRQKSKAARFGLTLEEVAEYEKVRACEVCGSTEKLCIDHNHTTGEIRGILCSGCNTALGLAKDNPTTLRALADYLDERGKY